MRFLHTADWQIGMKASHVGEAGEIVRKARLESLHRIVEIAGDRRVDFVLVAGDCFEDNGVDRILVQKVVDILRGSAAPVFLIPGNHDPYTPGSVWEYPAWKQSDTLRVLAEASPIAVPGGMLYPCPLYEKRSRKDPTSWIVPTESEGVRIGLAHGTIEGIPQDEPDYPIPSDAAERSGLDFLAVGHWHSTALYEDSSGCPRMAYSGTHETTKFGERDSGNILLVEIEERGAPPKVQSIRCGKLNWLRFEREFREEGDAARLEQEIESVPNPETTLLQAIVSGLLPASDRSRLLQMERVLESRFLYRRLETVGLRPSPEDKDWVCDLPVGVLQETGRRLAELADPAYSGVRPQLGTPEMAARALLELYALVVEPHE